VFTKNKELSYVILTSCVLFIALAFRFSLIDSWLPVFVDEGVHLYNAGTIWLENQQFSLDTWQHKGIVTIFSLIFYVLGDYNLLYLRLFEAVCGVLSILLSFIMFKKMYGFRVGFIAGLLLSIMPYHVFYSRIGLFYSFRLLTFLAIVFLTLKFQSASESKKSLIFILISIITSSLLQLDPTQLIWLIPYLSSFFLMFFLRKLWKGHKNLDKNFEPLIFDKKLLLIVFLAVGVLLFLLYELGSLQYFIGLITNVTPESGWEGFFGWQNLSSFLWSATWIAAYLLILTSFPIFILSISGLFVATAKRKHVSIILAWFFSILTAMLVGYYPRRVLIVTPLFALFAALSVDLIYQKIGANLTSPNAKSKGLKITMKGVSVKSICLVCLVVAVSLWPAFQSYEYITNFESLQSPVVPSIMRLSYVDEWVSGFRVEEAANFIMQNVTENSTILVDLENPIHLKALLLEHNYTIVPINRCNHGSVWSRATYENVLNDEEFDNSYFLFMYPSLIDWAATSELPWITVTETDFNSSDVDKNFAMYQSP